MSQNDVDDVLDYLTRIKSGGSVDIDQIEELQMKLRLFRTFSKYNHLLLPDFLDIIRKMAKLIVEKLHSVFDECKTNLNLERLESQLLEFIEGVPSLEYLFLWNSIYFQSQEWCLGDITFHKLKFLKLEWLHISRWDASEESFPMLETLIIKECDELEEIPLSFADIPTLKQIKLIGSWKESLEASAVRIKEEVEAIEGCDRINLVKQHF